MPLSLGDCQLRVVATQARRVNGHTVPGKPGPAATFHWRWYHHVPGLGLWAILLLLLLVRKANRNLQAWTILIPVALVAALWRTPLAILGISTDDWESIGSFVLSTAVALGTIALLADGFARLARLWRLLLSLAIMLGIVAIAFSLHFEANWSDEPGYLFSVCGSTAIIAMALAISARSSRGFYSAPRVLLWPVVWTAVLAAAVLMCLTVIPMALDPRASSQLPFLLVAYLAMALTWAAVMYAIVLPFLVLAVKCPLYRERLKGLLGLGDVPPETLDDDPFAHAIPLSTEPTERPVGKDAVLGRWSFYLDRVSKTVVLEFRPDGTFVQSIRPNQGEIQDCQGGTWRQEGSLIHLDGYVAAADGQPCSPTWWLIESPGELQIFGGDDPEHMFALHRLP